MSWDTELPFELRILINDIDASNYTYTDTQLKQFLVVATRQVTSELGPGWNSYIVGPYTINAASGTISPDPIASGTPIGFANLILLRSACIITRAEQKTNAAAGGWKIVDDKSTIDGTESVKAAKETADTFCNGYQAMMQEFLAGNINQGLQAVLSPYASYSYPPGVTPYMNFGSIRWGGLGGVRY